MRKFIALVAASAALFVATVASAASVDLTFTQSAPGSTTWALSIDVGAAGNPAALTAVTQVGFGFGGLGGTADFTITATSNVDPFSPTGTSAKNVINPGNVFHVQLAGPFSDPTGTIAANGVHLVLGNLLNAGSSASALEAAFIRGDVTQDGGTILDQNFAGIAESEVGVHFVGAPEPATMLLLGIGIAGLSLVRRKA